MCDLLCATVNSEIQGKNSENLVWNWIEFIRNWIEFIWNWDHLTVSSSSNSFLVQTWFQITFTECLLCELCSFEVLVSVFCTVFLCVVAESLWLSQASWVLTMFKTQHKPRFLRDTSQTSLPFVQTGSVTSLSRLCMYASLPMCVLAELLNYAPHLPSWLSFLLDGELLQVRICRIQSRFLYTTQGMAQRTLSVTSNAAWWLRTQTSGYRA